LEGKKSAVGGLVVNGEWFNRSDGAVGPVKPFTNMLNEIPVA
jgi:hypothetical protein